MQEAPHLCDFTLPAHEVGRLDGQTMVDCKRIPAAGECAVLLRHRRYEMAITLELEKERGHSLGVNGREFAPLPARDSIGPNTKMPSERRLGQP
jgi:hypothetical protein